MKSSLIPEKPILVYPSLAATLGLDEAVMLAALADLSSTAQASEKHGYNWYSLNLPLLHESLPFWDRRDLQRVSTALREKGVILIASAPLHQEDAFKFAFNEKAQAAKRPEPTPRLHHQQRPGKNYIAANWQPDQTTLDQLAQLNVSAQFALEQVPEFVTYWRERGETQRSWGQKFIGHTLARWRRFEERQHRRNRAQPIRADWSPSATCIDDLVARNIPREFVLEQIREFVTYWQASGERHISWESKFIQRVQNEWAQRETRRNVSTHAYPMSAQWRPSRDAIEVMTEKSAIPRSFIEDAIPEFVIYWQERGQSFTTWNSMFIKHVRLQWHRYQHSLDHCMEPQPIAKDWQPSEDVYDILKLANIDAEFARQLVPEFVLYWRDRNELHRSWNSRFLYHAKHAWAARHKLRPSEDTRRSTRDISLEEELNDTSWAS